MVYVNSIKRLILKADLRRESRILFLYTPPIYYLCNMNHIKELLNNNNTDKAIELLSLAIANNPHCDEAYFLLGNAHCKKNDWQQAMNASTLKLLPQKQVLHLSLL